MLDFVRLCEYLEDIPLVEPSNVSRTVAAFRLYCRGYGEALGDIVLRGDYDRDILQALNNRLFWAFGESGNGPAQHLCKILTLPRTLKHVLRRTWSVWKVLHGEVLFDELLICIAIRVTSPQAFQFLLSHRHALTDASGPRKIATDVLESRWDAQITDVDSGTADILWKLMRSVIPEHPPSDIRGHRAWRPQSIAHSEYWRRVVSEAPDPGVRDQQVLHDLQKTAADNERVEESSFLCRLMREEEYAGVCERVMQAKGGGEVGVSGRDICDFASVVFAEHVRRDGVNADEETTFGFLSLWRVMLRMGTPEDYVSWLTTEINRAMKSSLSFANAIYYYWASHKLGLLSPEDMSEVWAKLHAATKNVLATKPLAPVLGTRVPWALSYLVRGDTHTEPVSVSVAECRWVVDPLVRGIESDPTTCVTQACYLIKSSTDRIEHERAHPVRVRDHGINKEFVKELAPDSDTRSCLISAIVNATPDLEALKPTDREIVIAVRNAAQEWLSANCV